MNRLFSNRIFKYKIGIRRQIISTAERYFAILFRLIPRGNRFKTTIRLAYVLLPIFRLTSVYKQQLTTKVDGPYEIVLHFILNALTKNGTSFDPVIDVKGYEVFKKSYSQGRGVLVAGPHAALNLLLVRLLYDDGFNPTTVTPDEKMFVGGTAIKARTIQPSSVFLIQVKNILKNKGVVCAMPDRAEHHESRTIEFETVRGPVIFAPALFEVAVRCNSEVVLTEVHLEGYKAVATISAVSSASVKSLNQKFAEFVQTHIDCQISLFGQ